MENPDLEKPPSDGLEITSIGSLYAGGPWDKKYWSCSRGKDRYPYPIGYNAVRTHAGNTYRMEIREGQKGPLFVITSMSGESYFGQTPHIAWENFQKKSGPWVKTWHAKRFSCKIDGIERFGFRNPFVLRLLRQLVANANGTAECSSISSNLCNGASRLDDEKLSPESCTYPDLLQFLGRPKSTGKRIQKKKCNSQKATCELKKFPTQWLPSDAKVQIAMKAIRENGVSYEEAHGADRVHEDDCSTLLDTTPGCGVPHYNPVQSQKEGSIPIDRSSAVDLQVVSSSTAGKENGLLLSAELESAKESEYHVAETLDPLQENVADCSPRSHRDNLHRDKDKLVDAELSLRNSTSQCCVVVANYMPNNSDSENAKCSLNHIDAPPIASQEISCHTVLSAELVLSQGLMMGLHPEEMITSSNSNISSEKSDSDSSGQELLKSMMGVLLPRALPLLKRTSNSKKRRTIATQNAKTFFTKCDHQLNLLGRNSPGKNDGTHSLIDTVCQGSLENVKSVIPDSLEDDQTGCVVTHFDKKLCSKDVLGLNGDAGGGKGFSNCCSENGGNNGIIHEVDALPKSENLKSDSPMCCTPPSKQISSIEEAHNNIMNKIENALHIEVQHADVAEGFSVNPGFGSNKITVGSDLVPLSSSTEWSEQACPIFTNNLETVKSEVLATTVHGSRVTDTETVLDQRHPVNYDVVELPLITDTRDGENDLVDAIHIPQMGFDGKTADFTCDVSPEAASTENYSLSSHPCKKYNGPLSESIICRKIKGNVDNETLSAMSATKTNQAIAPKNHVSCKILLANEVKLDKEHHYLNMLKSNAEFNVATTACQSHTMVIRAAEDICSHSAYDHSVLYVKRHQVDAVVSELLPSYRTMDGNNNAPCIQKQGMLLSGTKQGAVNEAKLDSDDLLSDSKLQHKNRVPDDSFPEVTKSSNELEGFVELVGCYIHPTPVLSILLRREGDDIHICVLCGCLEDNDRTLFIYKLSIIKVEKHFPSFLGYTSIALPLSKATSDRNIAFERSGIQFAPDDQCLVLLSSIRAPCCREQNINCLCLACTSVCCEENAVKVVRVQLGYVSVVVELTTTETVYCILVCEPCYLVAVGESGRLHVWIMNSTWSAEVDYFMLPSFDYVCPSVLELKRIPTCASLVVGHNGIGCFGLWDISKRILIARFSASASIFQALPVGFFSWQTTKSKVVEHVKEIIMTTEMGLTEADVHNGSVPPNGEDIAVWLLVYAAADFDAQHSTSMNCHNSSIGWWRLALLVKNTVIMGSILDSRASALNVLGGCGIIGTSDGLAYMWELSTGKKLVDLHHFTGGISCIATEAETGTLAVADKDGRLLVYVQHPKNCMAKEPN